MWRHGTFHLRSPFVGSWGRCAPVTCLDLLNHKDKNCAQVEGCSTRLASTSSLPSMFGNSEQKLALNEIYILASLYKRHKDLVYYLKSCKPKLGGFCTLLTYIQFINPKLLAVQLSPRIISPPSICLNCTLILVICSWAIRPHGSLPPLQFLYPPLYSSIAFWALPMTTKPSEKKLRIPLIHHY